MKFLTFEVSKVNELNCTGLCFSAIFIRLIPQGDGGEGGGQDLPAAEILSFGQVFCMWKYRTHFSVAYFHSKSC